MIEYENSSYLKFSPFPNRLDLFSWQGIIDEIGILLNCKVNLISLPVISGKIEEPISVTVTTNDCREFHLGLVKNIKVKESPSWAKE